MKPARLFCALFACVAMPGHASETPPAEPAGASEIPAAAARVDYQARRDETAARLRELIGHPYAVSRAQCRLLGIGRRPCGGPEEYLAYSTLNTDESRVQPLVSAYNAAVRGAAAPPADGACTPLADHVVVLEDNVCIARPREAAQAAAQ